MCVFLYLLYLLKIRLSAHSKKPSFFLNIIHSFYLLLTASTFLLTLFYAVFFPLYFSNAVIILLLLLLVFVYLFYLRLTDSLKYTIILQEMPRLPLILMILVSFFSMGFILLEYCIQIQLIWGFSIIPFLDPSDSLEKSTPETCPEPSSECQ